MLGNVGTGDWMQVKETPQKVIDVWRHIANDSVGCPRWPGVQILVEEVVRFK